MVSVALDHKRLRTKLTSDLAQLVIDLYPDDIEATKVGQDQLLTSATTEIDKAPTVAWSQIIKERIELRKVGAIRLPTIWQPPSF